VHVSHVQHLCSGNPELNAAAGLLCSSTEEDEVEQDISSPDASSEDDLAPVATLIVANYCIILGLLAVDAAAAVNIAVM